MKPSRLEDHMEKNHADKKDKGFSYFHSLKHKFLKQPTLVGMFSSGSKEDIDGLRASYNISLLIAKCGKPHTIGGELILPAVSVKSSIQYCTSQRLISSRKYH